MPDFELLTSDEVARMVKVTRQHVNKLRQRGELIGIKLGGAYRYHPDDIDKYIETHRTTEDTHA